MSLAENVSRKPVNYGRGGEGHVDLDAAARANMDKAIKGSLPEKKQEEFYDLAGELKAEVEGKAFPEIIKGFSSDVENLRKKIGQYGNASEARLRELYGQEILSQADVMSKEIESQIEVSTDPYEKGDLANISLELANLLKIANIKLTEKKVANE